MAGEGLIWSALGQGIANAGSSMSQYMFKDIASDEARQDRMDLQRERIAASEEQKRRDREMRLSIEESRRDRSGGGGGGGGAAIGFDPEDFAPGGKLANLAANKLNLSEAEYKRDWDSFKSGDKSAYEVTSQGWIGSDDPEGEQGTIKSLPKGFEAEYKAKQKALGDLQEQYALTSRFDDVAKGRQTAFQTGVGEGILSGQITGKEVGRASQAVGSMLGKESYKIEGGEKMGVFTGASDTTPLGKAQAFEARAKGDAAETKAERTEKTRRETTADLDRQVKNAKEALAEVLGVPNNEMNIALSSLKKKALTDPKAQERLDGLAPQIEALGKARDRLTVWEAKGFSNESSPAPKAEKPPSVSDISGLPPGAASIGLKTVKGWEIKDKNGKLLGHGYVLGR